MTIARLGLIGDVHAADGKLTTAINFLLSLDVAAIICVGDIADGHGSLDKCCRLLQSTPVLTVRGNHDSWFLNNQMRDLPIISRRAGVSESSWQFLNSLPQTLALETTRGKLLLCHGTGTNDMHAVLPDDSQYALESNDELQSILRNREFRFMVCGHSHRRMVRCVEHLTIVNPGPLAQMYATDDKAGIAVADFEGGVVQFYDFENNDLAAAGEPASLTC